MRRGGAAWIAAIAVLFGARRGGGNQASGGFTWAGNAPLTGGGNIPEGAVVEGGRVLQGYRPPHHDGVDLAAPEGTPVRAARGGIVARVWPDGAVAGYGTTVVLRHPQGAPDYGTLYAHLARARVRVGDVVVRGQWIGDVGRTSAPSPWRDSTPPHLHFEVLMPAVGAFERDVSRLRGGEGAVPPRRDPLAWAAEVGTRLT